MPSSFEAEYPSIARWVREFGQVEIGHDPNTNSFVRAIDEGGMPWSGKRSYGTIDGALRDLERGLKAFLAGQSLAKEATSDRRNGKRAGDRRRKSSRTSDTNEGKKAPRKGTEIKPRPEESPAARKVRKLLKLPEALRQNERTSVTRLTVVKGLCENPEDAGAFALFLARGVQRRMREKNAPERYLELVNRAVRELKPYLNEPTEERGERLWSLLRQIEAEQNEYENIPWGVVRNVKSFDLLTVEHALRGVLRPDEAPYWLYYAARDYTGKTGELPPSSAPVVEEIAEFWRKHLKVKA
jgi:hypothetical protein